jgi:hypothetical protein
MILHGYPHHGSIAGPISPNSALALALAHGSDEPVGWRSLAIATRSGSTQAPCGDPSALQNSTCATLP